MVAEPCINPAANPNLMIDNITCDEYTNQQTFAIASILNRFSDKKERGNQQLKKLNHWSRGKVPYALTMMPTMTPNIPRALPKISTIRILTNKVASFASARAQLLPETPTQTPLPTFVKPAASPAKNTAYAA